MYTCCLWDVYNLAPQQSHRRLFLCEQFSRKDVHTGNVSGYAPGYAVLTKTPERGEMCLGPFGPNTIDLRRGPGLGLPRGNPCLGLLVLGLGLLVVDSLFVLWLGC